VLETETQEHKFNTEARLLPAAASLPPQNPAAGCRYGRWEAESRSLSGAVFNFASCTLPPGGESLSQRSAKPLQAPMVTMLQFAAPGTRTRSHRIG
jgi:hypothetical protein